MVDNTLPVRFERNYKGESEVGARFLSTAALNAWLTNPTRYAGQPAVLVEGGVVTQYVLNAAENAWELAGGGGGGSGTALATSDKLKLIEALATQSTTTWLGDSITEDANGYIRHVSSFFGSNTFTNRATGGHTSIDVRDTQLPLAVADNAYVYIVACGVNDIRYNDARGETTLAGYLANMKTISDALKATANSPTIAFVSIFPTYWEDQFDAQYHKRSMEVTKEWNDGLKEFCRQEGVLFIDMFNPIYNTVNAYNHSQLYTDDVHPSSSTVDSNLDTGALLYADAFFNDTVKSTASELVPTGKHFFKLVMHDHETAGAGGFIGLRNVDVVADDKIGLSRNLPLSDVSNLFGAYDPAANYYNHANDFPLNLLFSTSTYPTNGVNLSPIFSGTGVARGPKSFSVYYSQDPKAMSDLRHPSWELKTHEPSNDGLAINILPSSRKGYYYKFEGTGTGVLNLKSIITPEVPVRVNIQNILVASEKRFPELFKGTLTNSADGLQGNQPSYVVSWESPYLLDELTIESFSGLTGFTIEQSFSSEALSDPIHPTWVQVAKGDSDGTIALVAPEPSGTTGVLSGGVISIGAPTNTFSVTGGMGVVVDSHTDPSKKAINEVDFSGGFTNVPVTDIATSVFTAIGIDKDGLIVQKANALFTVEEERDIIALGTLIHTDLTNIESVSNNQQLSFGGLHNVYDLASTIGFINVTGNDYKANGANLQIDRSTGKTFGMGSNYANSTKSPNIQNHLGATALSFSYNRRDGVGGFIVEAPVNAIAPALYDDGSGTLQPVSSNNWTIQRVYFVPSSGNTFIQYGQTVFNTLNAAVRGIIQEALEKDPRLDSALLREYILVRGGATDLSDSGDCVFVEAGKFGEGVANGAGSSSSTLQTVYENSTQPQIVFNDGLGGLDFRDSLTEGTTELLGVSNNDKSKTYFSVNRDRVEIEDADGKFVANEDFFIRQLENFKVNDSSLFTTSVNMSVADEIVNPIDGHRSVAISQSSALSSDYAHGVAFDLAKSYIPLGKKVRYEFDFSHNGQTGEYKAEFGTNQGPNQDVIIEQTSGTISFEYEKVVGDITAYFRIYPEIPNDANVFIIDNLRINTDPQVIKSFNKEQTYLLEQDQANMLSASGNLRYDLSSNVYIENDGHELIRLEDDATNGRTNFRAVKETSVTVSTMHVYTNADGRTNFIIYNNDDTAKYSLEGHAQSAAGRRTTNTFTFKLQAGQYFILDTNSPLSGGVISNVTFKATAISEGTVYAGQDGSQVWAKGTLANFSNSASRTIMTGMASLEDANGIIDSANNRVIVSESGLYTIEINGALSASGSSLWSSVALEKNGSYISPDNAFAQFLGNVTSGDAGTRSITLPLSKNDVLRFGAIDSGSVTLENITFTISKSGTSIDNYIIENPQGEFFTKERILASNHTSVGDVTGLTFTGLEVNAQYILTGSARLYGTPSGDNVLRFMSGANNTGTLYGTSSNSDTATGDDVPTAGVAAVFTAQSSELYAYHTSTSSLYGNGGKDYTFLQVTKLPKSLGVDLTKQVVTDRVIGGVEYVEKSYLWDGKPIKCRTFDTSFNIPAGNAQVLATIPAGLDVIWLEGIGIAGSNWQDLVSPLSGGGTSYFRYDDISGNITVKNDGANFTRQRFTIKYL